MSEYRKDEYELRRFAAEDWKAFRAIRLKALATTPGVYGSNYQLEWELPDEHWIGRLRNEQNATWGLYHKEELIGLTSANCNGDDPEEVRFTASFIMPEHRGKGLAHLFYQARIEWARSQNMKRAIVTHRGGNEPSRAANQRHGFRYMHTEQRLWPDGVEDDHLFYMLEL